MKKDRYFRLSKLSRMSLGCLASLLVFSLVFAHSALAYNDFLTQWFWVNAATSNAQDFQVVILPNNASNGSGSGLSDFVTGWLGINTANTVGPNFVQVGTIADGSGVRWFAYTSANAGAACFPGGTSAWGGNGCIGLYNDHVAVGVWTRVELVNYGQGFWIARVWDQANHPVDVAKLYISTTSGRDIYTTSEQAYASSTSLQLNMAFLYYNPQYMLWGTGFQHWPAATANFQNYFNVNSSVAGKVICPPYGQIFYQPSPPYWFMGKTSSTVTCVNAFAF